MTDDDVVAYLSGESDTPPPIADSARLERSRAVLGEPSLWAEPSPDLAQRVIDAVNQAGPSTSSVSNIVAAQAESSPRSRRPTRRWVRNALLGAAAAVLLAVGLATVVSTHGNQPVQFAAALRGTELAPGATGSVTLTQTSSGWRIHLSATGLPRLDDGSYYQAWLKDPSGVLVPIGTFNQPTDVTLWAGVPPTSYPTITITKQRAGDGPASSGQKVLLGTSHRSN